MPRARPPFAAALTTICNGGVHETLCGGLPVDHGAAARIRSRYDDY
jgi:hypothetical protein